MDFFYVIVSFRIWLDYRKESWVREQESQVVRRSQNEMSMFYVGQGVICFFSRVGLLVLSVLELV